MTHVAPREPTSRRFRGKGRRRVRGIPRILVAVISLFAGGAILYLAQAVLMPIALAVLLAFLLGPIVGFLERRRLGRVVPVLVVVVLVFLILGTVTSILVMQLLSLSGEIPKYRENLKAKIAEVRGASKGGALEEVQTTVKEVTEELQKEESRASSRDTSGRAPVPVIVKSEPTGFWQLPTLLEGLTSAGVVFVLVIFMLLERQELRNRLIRLIGYGRLTTTTRAMDEAGRRISRYLLMQTIINGSFGLGIAVGLLLIGVPYAALWGFLAATLRFIPYVGPWLAAVLVIAISLAVFPGWLQPLLVAGLFVALELLSNMVMEPILYGQSAGVSQVALLAAAIFWTWLWGPIGLLLATPLTVCLVVLGKHVPEMEFIVVLLADEPVMDPDFSYYQRLLAGDADEAADIVVEYRKAHPLDAAYDEVILPALNHAKRDRRHERLSATDEELIWQATREIVEDLAAEHDQAAAAGANGNGSSGETGALRKVCVLGCPARDEADALALLMLQQLLDPARWEMEIESPNLLVSEMIARVEEQRPAVVCIGALPSGESAAHTRLLCKRLRQRCPELKIVVGRWGLQSSGYTRDLILAAGADHVGATLVETRDQIQQISHLEPDAPSTLPGEAGLKSLPRR